MKKLCYVALLIFAVACSREPPRSANDMVTAGMLATYPEVASEFATALVEGEYEVAHSMLDSKLAQAYSVVELGKSFESMLEYGDSNIKSDGVLSAMEDWPARQPTDVGWAYVSITGDEFAEAVTVIVSVENGEMKIRDIEWGRP